MVVMDAIAVAATQIPSPDGDATRWRSLASGETGRLRLTILKYIGLYGLNVLISRSLSTGLLDN